MKVAILGGGGLRTPLLIRGLCDSRLPVTRVSLYDVDDARVRTVVRIVGDSAPGIDLAPADSVDEAILDSSFVFASIRAGGIEARAEDEALCRRMGWVAQETVGVLLLRR